MAGTADILDLKNCSSFGETPEQTLNKALIAKDTWLCLAENNNKPILVPEYKPAIYQVV